MNCENFKLFIEILQEMYLLLSTEDCLSIAKSEMRVWWRCGLRRPDRSPVNVQLSCTASYINSRGHLVVTSRSGL